MCGRKFLIAIALLLTVGAGRTYGGEDPWISTASEIAHAYKYQIQFGARLRNPLKPESCAYGQKDFPASYRGRDFAVPCRFVLETTRQLKELLASGAAKYLFPLDIDHGDFGVPAEVWEAKYKMLPAEEVLPKLLRDPQLMAIYNTGVRSYPDAIGKNSGANNLGQKITVVGFYDGRPNQVLAKRSHKEFYYEPAGLVRLAGFNMMAHQLGELVLLAGETVVVFDMSFDNDRAAPDIPGAVNVIARTK